MKPCSSSGIPPKQFNHGLHARFDRGDRQCQVGAKGETEQADAVGVNRTMLRSKGNGIADSPPPIGEVCVSGDMVCPDVYSGSLALDV